MNDDEITEARNTIATWIRDAVRFLWDSSAPEATELLARMYGVHAALRMLTDQAQLNRAWENELDAAKTELEYLRRVTEKHETTKSCE